MKDSISLTVQLDEKSLAETSKMLAHMADYFVASEPAECDGSCGNCDVTDNSHIEATIPDVESTTAEAFDQTNISSVTPISELANVVDETPAPPPSTGVELDSDGLPWDVRIHGKSKLKLKKTEQWKKKKGVDPTLVITVESELKAAMSAPLPSSDGFTVSIDTPLPPISELANVVDETPTPAPPPPTAEQPAVKYLVDGKAYTADELKGFNSGWNDENIATLEIESTEVLPETVNMTFPNFMAKITAAMSANAITKEDVDNACTKHGLASLPLLANRPDLIPAVNAELFA